MITLIVIKKASCWINHNVTRSYEFIALRDYDNFVIFNNTIALDVRFELFYRDL